MTVDEVVAEARRRIDENSRDKKGSWATTPDWANYFQGYRDALGELIEWLEEAK